MGVMTQTGTATIRPRMQRVCGLMSDPLTGNQNEEDSNLSGYWIFRVRERSQERRVVDHHLKVSIVLCDGPLRFYFLFLVVLLNILHPLLQFAKRFTRNNNNKVRRLIVIDIP